MVTPEDRPTRLRRLHMRSIRRGIKEMDLILTQFATTQLPDLSDQELDLYEDFLSESDHDLYQWLSGQAAAPARHDQMMARLSTALEGVSARG